MATGTPMPSPYQTVLDLNGHPVAGGKIATYIAGTTTPVTTYADAALSVPNANPIIADGAGRFVAFLTPGSSYKFVYQDASGASLGVSVDNISAVPPTSINVDVTGTAGETIAAGQVCYLSDGSGGKTAGSWYQASNANPYSSTTPQVGMTPSAIASGASGTFRTAGQITGLSSLTVGTTYYIGTGGSVTAGKPTNARVVGVADSTSSLVISPDPAVPSVDLGACNGRLTLTTGTPVTTSDVTAATTLYFTPYGGNRIALYDGANWTVRQFGELSIAVPSIANTNYDVFCYDNGGSLTLELAAWTTDSSRATALTTQDGVYVKSGATTRRYLGTIRTTSVSGQCEDSLAKRFVWNYYHRARRPLERIDPTTTWTYTTATYRQANGSASNQVAAVIGVAEVTVSVAVRASATNTNATPINIGVSIGLDSTATASTTRIQVPGTPSSGFTSGALATVVDQPAAGYHFWTWLEISAATGTTTWNGDAGSPFIARSGMDGALEG